MYMLKNKKSVIFYTENITLMFFCLYIYYINNKLTLMCVLKFEFEDTDADMYFFFGLHKKHWNNNFPVSLLWVSNSKKSRRWDHMHSTLLRSTVDCDKSLESKSFSVDIDESESDSSTLTISTLITFFYKKSTLDHENCVNFTISVWCKERAFFFFFLNVVWCSEQWQVLAGSETTTTRIKKTCSWMTKFVERPHFVSLHSTAIRNRNANPYRGSQID